MGLFKDIFEPGCIITLFIVGAVVNREPRTSTEPRRDTQNNFPPPNECSSAQRHRPWMLTIRRSVTKMQNATTHVLKRFPFILEIFYWNLTYWGYQLARAGSASLIRNNKHIQTKAMWHAMQILSLERDLGIDIEKGFQSLIMSKFPRVMSLFAIIYHSHIIVGVAFIVYCFTYLPFSKYACIRRTIFLDNWIAFLILSTWRCMPPRLMSPQIFSMVDILHLHKNQGSVWSDNRYQLTIAAMPSLHFGTSAFFAWSLWRFSPHPWLRVAAWVWPVLMLCTILATANHWILDAFVGAFVPVFGWRFNRAVSGFSKIEYLAYRLFGIEKPEMAEKRPGSDALDAKQLV